jgi:Tol biopolymer transport system component/DNA-binding winged helix-turn-helix (wHTH) protein
MSSNLSSNYLQFKFAMGNGFKHSIYAFDEFRLDAVTLMLYRGGQPVTLPPKVVKTLAVLVEHRGSIVSKEQLIEGVWQDAIVEESNLSQNLYLLRKTLGSRPDGEPYIETLRRRGYRFAAESVSIESADEFVSKPNGAEPVSVPRFAYERRGNVVALVDWKEPDETAAEQESSPAAKTPPERHRSSWMWPLLYVVLLIVPLSIVGVAVWLRSADPVHSASENFAAVESLQLTNGDDVSGATISRDGKYFVYHEIDGDYSRMIVQQTGQTAKLEVLPRARREMATKSFSPDGQFIYYVAKESGAAHWSIYRVPTLGGVQVKIVEDAQSHPSFSPDGKSMVFWRGDGKARKSSLVTADASGTNEKTLLDGSADTTIASYPAWSPDGKLIAYGSVSVAPKAPGICTIFAFDLETGTSRELSHEKWEACHRMEWRRDGQAMIVIGTKYGESGTTRRDQVYSISATTGESLRLTADPYRKQYDSLGVTDSNEIFCVPFNRASQLWVMNPNGSAKTATAITTGSSDGKSGLVPLSDGRIAFVARTGENVGGWLVNGDGSDRRQVISTPSILEELRATADGKYFFFSAKLGDRNHIYRVDADGTNLKQITTGDSFETDSSVSPDGKWIVYDSAPATDIARHILMRTSTEGGTPAKITDLQCNVPNYSPSGKFISCTPDWERIFVFAADDGSLVKTFDTAKVPALNIGAKWTPDEKALVYISSQKSSTNLWMRPIDRGPARQLTDFPNGDIYNFAYSQDGSKLYLARGLQTHDAVLIKGLP